MQQRQRNFDVRIYVGYIKNKGVKHCINNKQAEKQADSNKQIYRQAEKYSDVAH